MLFILNGMVALVHDTGSPVNISVIRHVDCSKICANRGAFTLNICDKLKNLNVFHKNETETKHYCFAA